MDGLHSKSEKAYAEATRLLKQTIKFHQSVKQLADMVKASLEPSEAGRTAEAILKSRLKQEFIPKEDRRPGICYCFPCQSPQCHDLKICKP